MPDLTTAIDETAANVIVPKALAAQTLPTQSGSTGLGPFGVSWSASGVLSGGTVDLIPPPTGVIRIDSGRLNYSLGLILSLDLSFLDLCLPRICVTIPFIGRVCVCATVGRGHRLLSGSCRGSVRFPFASRHVGRLRRFQRQRWRP